MYADFRSLEVIVDEFVGLYIGTLYAKQTAIN